MRLLLALLVAFPVLASITTSSLTGRVSVGGKPAPGVTVTAASTVLQQPRVTVTNAHGRYWLGALPPGQYDVTFSLAGHTTLTRRPVLELARVARADATLEPNPDEDSVTSTTKTISVADTIFSTSHFDDRALDRLPLGRLGTAALAPGSTFVNLDLADGVPSGALTSEETVEQLTVVNGPSPVEWDTFASPVTALRTRHGGEDFFATLRDTVTEDDGLMHFGEATAGGRIVPERLWFFAAAWLGEQDFPNPSDFRGAIAKVDAQLGEAHHLDVSAIDSRQKLGFLPFDSNTASLRYTGVFGPRLTSEVLAARTNVETYDVTSDYLTGRASYTVSDHVLTAGFTTGRSGTDFNSLFASDRWSVARWNVYAGLRYDDGPFNERLTPRVAVAYDLRGDGTRAITASWGEYAFPSQPQSYSRVMSLGYSSAIGNAGTVRADVLRRETSFFWQNELQLDARYRLFDRFDAGATYTYSDRPHSGFEPAFPDHVANVWLGAELPVGNHEFGATVLQRYIGSSPDVAPTDVALRYTIPFTRATLLLAADATNVFLVEVVPRAVRVWARVRI